MHPFLWWFLFTVAAIWAQRFVPGIDFLAPGIIICLQLDRPRQAFWLALIWILLQEGMGSMSFGAGLLWYGAMVLLYFLGRWLFESRNLLFIFFIGLCIGAWHFILIQLMAKLEGMVVAAEPLAWESLLQAAVFTLEWGIVYSAYKRILPDERAL